MTTNKPKVVAWKWRKSVVNDHGETVGGTCKLGEAPGVPLVRLSDYKALQAECERLRRDAELWEDVADYVGVYQKGSAVGCQMRLLSGGVGSGAQIAPDLSPSP